MQTLKPIVYPNNGNLRIRSRRGIPHFELDRGIYFLTFRLADSLPDDVIQRLLAERKRYFARIERIASASPMEIADAAAKFGRHFDAELDANHGRCGLRNESVARLVDGAVRFFDGERYSLIAWALMPNHVHVVLQLFQGADLGPLMHSWKSYTAKKANRILGRDGRFWQREYFDRIVRDDRELRTVVEYTVNNPAVAGLTQWPFTGVTEWWR